MGDVRGSAPLLAAGVDFFAANSLGGKKTSLGSKTAYYILKKKRGAGGRPRLLAVGAHIFDQFFCEITKDILGD